MAKATPLEADLICCLQRGNQQAFEAVYAASSAAVHRFAFHMTRSAEAADEIVQETFLFLIADPGKFDPTRGSLLCFLLGVARNLARRRRDTATVPLAETIPAGIDFSGQSGRDEEIAAVREAIATLPSRYREVVVLCDLQELDYASAASIVGCPTGTIRSRLHRARALLAARLQARCFRCCV